MRFLNKKAFTLTEIIVALFLLSVTAAFSITLYTTARDTNKEADDTYYIEMAQITAIEDLQRAIDEGENLPGSYDVEMECGRFMVKTSFIIEQSNSLSGKEYYLVQATTRIGGTDYRKVISRMILTREAGGLYEDF